MGPIGWIRKNKTPKQNAQLLPIFVDLSCRMCGLKLKWGLKKVVPSGKRSHNYGKSPFLMGKSTISMAIFNSYVTNYQRVMTMTVMTMMING